MEESLEIMHMLDDLFPTFSSLEDRSQSLCGQFYGKAMVRLQM